MSGAEEGQRTGGAEGAWSPSQGRARVLFPSLTCRAALDKSLRFSELQCPLLKSEVNKNTDLTGANEKLDVKGFCNLQREVISLII